MDESLEAFDRLKQATPSPYSPAPRPEKAQHPKGWEPGVQWDGHTGTITSRPTENPRPDWSDLLKAWGFDPELFEVVDDTVRVSTWDGYAKDNDGNIVSKQLWSHRAHIRSKKGERADMLALMAEVRRRRYRKPSQTTGDAPVTFVVAPSDIQMGKSEGGGSPATVARTLEAFEKAAYRLDDLRSRYNIEAVLTLLPGDNSERCSGSYSTQTFTTDLNERDQFKIVRRVIERGIDMWSGLAPRVVCTGVASNHGEVRQGGKKITDDADNSDLALLECLADIYQKNPDRYGHVSFVIPDDQYGVVLNASGVNIGCTHGHMAGGSGPPMSKMTAWWKNMKWASEAVGDSEILFVGHHHHFAVHEDAGHTLIQCPSLDGGSKWLKDKSGIWSPPGLVTTLVGASLGSRKWLGLRVIE